MSTPLLSMRGITKRFGGVHALRDGNLTLRRGEVHALCGGNGAGKSTILGILMGFHKPDSGTIEIDGAPVHFTTPTQALNAGIAIVQQELSGVPQLSVAENIYLGAEPRHRGFIDFETLNRNAAELLDRLGFDIDPKATLGDLAVATQQLVEIAKALSHGDSDVLIFDEPTSALGEKDVQRLFEVIRELAAAGKGIVYVTHRLQEVFTIADAYTVFKDGETVDEGRVADITREGLIESMIGGAIEGEFVKENVPSEKPLLEVRGVTRAPRVKDISFRLHAGEILGIYGLVGSGRSELLDTVYGLETAQSGSIAVAGKPLAPGNVDDAIRAGLTYVTEDRARSGLVLGASVGANLALSKLRFINRFGFVDERAERDGIATAIEQMNIKTPGPDQIVSFLSGGNQQKVVLGRCTAVDPRVMLLDEPTRGVDVGAKKEIYRFISDFASKNGAVLMVSSDLEEILGMSDRILVLRDGKVACEFPRAGATQKDLMMAAV
ncbi:sugar ABC transporter ATP-binding protein [Tropicimonas isoalkanivorans]|uniref:Monosaccharide ABC transporter ATP-binding protein, CUT2 family n=1 Tax=Tropicimonas isoalkanivorans TaxID=441112 RepID=A0A1I1IC79_9RHOB|nr:sugar ABC transporter ATP-binding protein [Tropicimonas isoalkanivorans]SFC33999.1 monosaccharide ABC transporter ATP-binding protein, CUT2 family [Tropicimonas isoalkanivorans]